MAMVERKLRRIPCDSTGGLWNFFFLKLMRTKEDCVRIGSFSILCSDIVLICWKPTQTNRGNLVEALDLKLSLFVGCQIAIGLPLSSPVLNLDSGHSTKSNFLEGPLDRIFQSCSCGDHCFKSSVSSGYDKGSRFDGGKIENERRISRILVFVSNANRCLMDVRRGKYVSRPPYCTMTRRRMHENALRAGGGEHRRSTQKAKIINNVREREELLFLKIFHVEQEPNANENNIIILCK